MMMMTTISCAVGENVLFYNFIYLGAWSPKCEHGARFYYANAVNSTHFFPLLITNEQHRIEIATTIFYKYSFNPSKFCCAEVLFLIGHPSAPAIVNEKQPEQHWNEKQSNKMEIIFGYN